MQSFSCQIEFVNEADAVRCGKPAVAEGADCGIPICSDCRTEFCEESFCEYCYEYHDVFLLAKTRKDRAETGD